MKNNDNWNYAAACCPLNAQRPLLKAALTAPVGFWGKAVDCGWNATGTVPS